MVLKTNILPLNYFPSMLFSNFIPKNNGASGGMVPPNTVYSKRKKVQLVFSINQLPAYVGTICNLSTELSFPTNEKTDKKGFSLRCIQRLSCRNVATEQCYEVQQLLHQRFLLPGPLVLRIDFFSFFNSSKIGAELFHNVLNPAHVPF